MCEWLEDNALSAYESTFAAHKLNSLRKVCLLTSQQLDQINNDFCLATSNDVKDKDFIPQGQRVVLGEAVEALKGQKESLPLKEQLRIYRDPKVSGLNLIGAQNQLEVLAAKRKWKLFVF